MHVGIRWVACIFMGLSALGAQAQAFGSCRTGTAQQTIENLHLQASVFNTGGLFFGGSTTSGDGYLIPKQDGASPIFAAALWLGGHVGGELRVAAARFGAYNFWPGPLEDAASPPTDCSAYDRIFVVSRDDIRRYYETGEMTDDLRDWPHHLGAPVLDGDGDSTNYDLRDGDQPDLIGDVAAWWVMNDAGNEHPAGGSTPPMGVEVRAHAFVYGMAGEATSPTLAQTTFIRYEIINRGQQPIEGLYASMFVDADLGGAGDDYIGSDTLRNLMFVYNESNEDSVYGKAPPSQGVQVLQGPVGLANGRDDDFDGDVDEPGERLGATSTSRFISGGPSGQGDPDTAQSFFHYMEGVWQDGTPMFAFGSGYQENGPITRYIYSGDPVTESFWSELNTDGNGTDSASGDRRMLISTGPSRLDAGASTSILYAFPYGRGTDYLQSVAVLRTVATALGGLSANAFVGRRVDGEVRGPNPMGGDITLSSIRPDPSAGGATTTLSLPVEAHVLATVHDVLGRQLEVLVEGVLPEGEAELVMPSGLAVGVYVLRVEVGRTATESISFTVVR